jgi:hypothetical protein
MTANQISYAMSVESQRHNQANEDIENAKLDEVERHNKEIEKLESDKVRIQEIYNSQMTYLKQAELDHRKYYDELALQIQKEQGDAKIALQAQLNEITETYNQQKAMLESEANATKEALKDIEQQKVAETIRYNDMLKTFKAQDVELQKWITDKKVQYDYHALDIESGLKRLDIQNTQKSLQLTETRDVFNFGLMSKEYTLKELYNAAQISNIEAQTKLTKSNKFWNPMRNMSQSFKDFSQGLKATTGAASDVVNMLSFGGL